MHDGTASLTARSVAARRLGFERFPSPYGNPAADEALASDVADGFAPEPGGMHEYIRGRTAFFDRVVVTAVDRGVRQVVNGGAGYDGRALRYAKPGVRWFEVDHPATQADEPGSPVGAPWLTSLLMYANCLCHLPDPGITIAELHARARTGTNLDGMRRWRYVTYTPDPGHGKRQKPLTRRAVPGAMPWAERGNAVDWRLLQKPAVISRKFCSTR